MGTFIYEDGVKQQKIVISFKTRWICRCAVPDKTLEMNGIKYG